MKRLRLKQIVILSNIAKAANRFCFGKGINLILGENDVGKTCLSSSIYWGFGCDPRQHPKWLNDDVKTIIDFEIGNDEYRVVRDGSVIKIRANQEPYRQFSKISGDYSEFLSEILNFKVVLNKRNSDEVVAPTPAYYFLPFYVSQDGGWEKPWDSFKNLTQFADWKREIIKYHIGHTNPNYYHYVRLLSKSKVRESHVSDNIDKSNIAFSVVQKLIPQDEVAFTENGIDSIKSELSAKLRELHNSQQVIFGELRDAQNELLERKAMLKIAEEAESELASDYVFSVDNVESDELECPVCGVIHDNSIINRFDLLKDIEGVEKYKEKISSKISSQERKVKRIESKINDVKSKFKEINSAYKKTTNTDLSEILSANGKLSLRTKLSKHKEDLAKEYGLLVEEIKNLKAALKDTVDSNLVELINSEYLTGMKSLLNRLNVTQIAEKDYEKPWSNVEESGSDKPRALLSYYINIYSLIDKYGDEVVSPLVIDSPYQQEQDEDNRNKITQVISDFSDSASQVLLFTRDYRMGVLKDKASTVCVLHDKYNLLKNEYYEIALDVYEEDLVIEREK